jgi:hypothetical protein
MTFKQTYKVECQALRNAIDRCHKQEHRRYQDYGARGITVADVFRDPITGFDDFFAEVGPRPSSGHSLDRIDNDRGYEPGNLRWATKQEQGLNTRKPRKRRLDFGHGVGPKNSVMIPYQGRVQSLAKWADELGLKRATLYDRLIAGMSIADAMKPEFISRNKNRKRENPMRNDELNERLNRLETSLEILSDHWASTQANTAALASATADRLNRIEANVAHHVGVKRRPGELEKAVDKAIAALDKAMTPPTVHVGEIRVTGELDPVSVRQMVRNEINKPKAKK